MSETSRFTIICPCCEATLHVDSRTGVIISHEEKSKPVASFDEMLKGLDKQKQQREQNFNRSSARSRIASGYWKRSSARP